MTKKERLPTTPINSLDDFKKHILGEPKPETETEAYFRGRKDGMTIKDAEKRELEVEYRRYFEQKMTEAKEFVRAECQARIEALKKELGQWIEGKIGDLMVAHGYKRQLPEMFDLCFSKEEIEALKSGTMPDKEKEDG